MAEKSISQQIIDDFIDKLQKSEAFEKSELIGLRELLTSGKVKKDDIADLLKKGKEK